MAKILITGAAGCIGSMLSRALLLEGHELTLLDNYSYGYPENLVFPDADLTPLLRKIDICDPAAMRAVFEGGWDCVYHFAAVSSLAECQRYPDRAVGTNIGATATLLELSRQWGVKRFLFASTSAVYEKRNGIPL